MISRAIEALLALVIVGILVLPLIVMLKAKSSDGCDALSQTQSQAQGAIQVSADELVARLLRMTHVIRADRGFMARKDEPCAALMAEAADTIANLQQQVKMLEEARESLLDALAWADTHDPELIAKIYERAALTASIFSCNEADAHLIASAPELYAELARVREILIDEDYPVRRTDDLLAKARGDSE